MLKGLGYIKKRQQQRAFEEITQLNEKDMNTSLQEVDTIESRPASLASKCLLKLEPTEISSLSY